MDTRLACVAVLVAGSLLGAAHSQAPVDAEATVNAQAAAAAPAPTEAEPPAEVQAPAGQQLPPTDVQASPAQGPADVAEQISKAAPGMTPGGPAAVDLMMSADGSAPAGTVPAIWVAKEVSFTYFSATSLYYCDGLRDKVKWVMKQLGVMDGYKVRIRSCFNTGGAEVSFGPLLDPLSRAEQNPRVVIEAVVPQRVTSELLEELSEREGERELIARVRGESSVVDNAEAQFAASTRRVSFDDESRRSRIEAGDCDLIQQMRDYVFVPLGFKIVEDRMNCAPNRVQRGSVNLQLEVLQPWQPEPAPVQPADPGAAQ
jgi:hypothetical protein